MAAKNNKNKIAVLYDFLQVKGGAEHVAIEMCKHLPNSELVTGWINSDIFTHLPIKEASVKEITGSSSILGWQTLKCAYAFLHKDLGLNNYKSVVYSGSNASLAAIKNTNCKNIYYCHTPPRFVYDLKDYYMDILPLPQKYLLQKLIHWYQPLFESAVDNMEHILCNSQNTQMRLKKYLGVEAEILYPPAKSPKAYSMVKDVLEDIEEESFYLSTARVEKYKRVDRIVAAFSAMPEKRLIVASGGSQLNTLIEQYANSPNIIFVGWLDEDKLAAYYHKCKASIYVPFEEDFGLSVIESMAYGKPVIGVNEGGLKETILENQTGIFIKDVSSVDSFKEGIEYFESIYPSFSTEKCKEQSEKFSADKFHKRMLEIAEVY